MSDRKKPRFLQAKLTGNKISFKNFQKTLDFTRQYKYTNQAFELTHT